MEQKHKAEEESGEYIIQLVIPRYAEARMTFACNADFDNVIIICDKRDGKIIERGNSDKRDLNPFVFKRDRSRERTIKIKGKHKTHASLESKGWKPSKPDHVVNPKDAFGSGVVSFDSENQKSISINYVFI